MSELSDLVNGARGYYRTGEEDSFPWSAQSKAVWYALIVIENGNLQRYGFSSTVHDKSILVKVLEKLQYEQNAILLGVWNGQYSTHLFVLDIGKAKEKLDEVLHT
ncbi:MAG: hypothetical protein ACYC7E_22855 [Armatimonadota bacterium]